MNKANLLVLAGCLAVIPAGPAASQQAGPTDAADAPSRDAPRDQPQKWAINYTILGGAEHQFETDLDGDNGEFDLTHFHIGLGVGMQFSDRLRLDLALGYAYDGYDFSGDAGFGAVDPWDNVNSMLIGARLTWVISQQWSVFGGPFLAFSAESGADIGDALTGGGVLGVGFRASDNFSLGVGIGITSEIEDDATVFPVISLNWKPTETLTVSSIGSVGVAGRGGLEIAWQFAEGWTFGGGVQYRSSRFRLDDNVPAARDGVGEHTALPIYGKVTWNPHPRAQLGLVAGVAAAGELRLEDEDGDRLAEEDYDLAPFVGVRFTLRF